MKCTAKPPIRLNGWPCWSYSSLDVHVILLLLFVCFLVLVCVCVCVCVCVFFFCLLLFFSCSGSYSPKANVKYIFCTDGSGSSVECASDWYSWGSQARIDSSTRQHSFVEIGHEIVSTTILSQPLYQVGQLPATVSLTVWARWSMIVFFFHIVWSYKTFWSCATPCADILQNQITCSDIRELRSNYPLFELTSGVRG